MSTDYEAAVSAIQAESNKSLAYWRKRDAERLEQIKVLELRISRQKDQLRKLNARNLRQASRIIELVSDMEDKGHDLTAI